MKLIENWGDWWKLWSVRAHAAETAFWTLLLTWSDMGVSLWNMMPSEVKDVLPEKAVAVLPALFFGSTLFLRVAKQLKLVKTDDQPGE